MYATVQNIRFNVTASGILRAVVTLMNKANEYHTIYLNTFRYQQLALDERDEIEFDDMSWFIKRLVESNDMEDRLSPPLPSECPSCEGPLEAEIHGIRTQAVCLDCRGRSAVINDITGSMLKLAPKGSVIAIPVNTVGVHGRGLALYMRTMYKTALGRYMRLCKSGKINTGDMEVVEEETYKVALFPTKYDWRHASCTRLIHRSATRLRNYLDAHGITEVHLPRVGCGEYTGGLNYHEDVRPIFNEVFANSGIQVNVYDWSLKLSPTRSIPKTPQPCS